MPLLTKLKNILPKKNSKEERSLGLLSSLGEEFSPWWGKFTVEEGQSRFWRVGNIIICLDRFTNEWHIGSTRVADDQKQKSNKSKAKQTSKNEEQDKDKDLEANVSDADEEDPKFPRDKLKFRTFTFRTQAEVSLRPVLSDRPLASKLERPLYIPGGEEIFLYVSSPLWVRIETGKPLVVLDEIPTAVLSDTWFGNNTLEGELCYAGETHCSTRLEDLPYSTDRIVSPMLIKNHSKSLMMLEKLSVPLPYLSVYTDKHNHLWTEQLNVYREGDLTPEVFVAKGPPKIVKDIELISKSRKEFKPTGWKSLFNSLLGSS